MARGQPGSTMDVADEQANDEVFGRSGARSLSCGRDGALSTP